MCVSVELESDLFRNTSVCLCGCLSTFTSYKKSSDSERGSLERGRRHINILSASTFGGFFLGRSLVKAQKRRN